MAKDFTPLLTSGILRIIFVLVFIVFLVASAILFYHWQAYGEKNKKIFFAEIAYFGGAVFLLFLAFFSLISY